MKFRVLALATLIVLGIMPAAHAGQKTTYRGTLGDGWIKFVVQKRESGRRFLFSETIRNITAPCEGGGEIVRSGSLDFRNRNVRVSDFTNYIEANGNGGLFVTEGRIGPRRGVGTLRLRHDDDIDDQCLVDLDWTVRRVLRPGEASQSAR